MTEIVIRIVNVVINGTVRSPPVPTFVQEYDPNQNDYSGYIVFTPDPEKALRFPGVPAAMEAWRAQSATTPLRPDGKPNRPLTAFSIEPMSLEKARGFIENPDKVTLEGDEFTNQISAIKVSAAKKSGQW